MAVAYDDPAPDDLTSLINGLLGQSGTTQDVTSPVAARPSGLFGGSAPGVMPVPVQGPSQPQATNAALAPQAPDVAAPSAGPAAAPSVWDVIGHVISGKTVPDAAAAAKADMAPPVLNPGDHLGNVLDDFFTGGVFRRAREDEYDAKLKNFTTARSAAAYNQIFNAFGDPAAGAPTGAPLAAAPVPSPQSNVPPGLDQALTGLGIPLSPPAIAGPPPGLAVGATSGPPPAIANYLRQRKALAMMATMSGHPDQADAMLKPKMAISPSGEMYDENSGSVVPGTNLSASNYQNGFRVNPNDPSSPAYVPTLAPGTMPDGKGGVIPIPGAIRSAAMASLADATGKTLGTVQTIPNSDGTTSTGLGANVLPGTPGMSGGSGQGVAGGPAGTAGVSQSPGDAEFAKGQGKDLNDTVNGLVGAREGALQTRQGALQTLAYAKSHPMNAATPHLVEAANALRALPPGMLDAVGIPSGQVDAAANDAGVFQRIVNQNLLQAGKTLLPSRYTERELMLARPIAGSLSTPNEAMEYTAALSGATAKRAQDQADFAASYNGPKTRQAFEQAWNASPQGQRSLFQDPEMWGGVTINGAPAVIYTQVKGQKVGVFAYKTPQQYVFPVR